MRLEEINTLREKRGVIIAAMGAILDKAQTEKRDLTAEETAAHAAAFKDQDALKSQIDLAVRQDALEHEMSAEVRDDRRVPHPELNGGDKQVKPNADLEMRAFRSWIKGGRTEMSAEESRALQFGTDTLGGFTSPPEQFIADLIKKVDNQVFLRGLATRQTLTGAHQLGVPVLDNDPADADWTTELLTGTADSTMSFGKRIMVPHPLAKQIKISNTLLRNSALPIESIVRDRLGYKVGITEEKAYLTGTGASQPLGIFIADANGINTDRDVSTGNTTSSPTFDGLIAAKYALMSAYHTNARWLFHRNTIEKLAKLKDGNGQYLWQLG